MALDIPLYLHCYRILLIDALILLQLFSYAAFNAESGTQPSIEKLKHLENCKWVSLGSPPVALLVALKTTQTPWDYRMDIYGYGLHVGCGLTAVKDLHS